ncbi:MAG: hypothetical protein Q9M31_10420 [Mariprofundus sp.]|nr:hypothetical protein [Mariprofundus sp.]
MVYRASYIKSVSTMIASMLPHRAPMLMITKLLTHDKQKIIALASIDANNPLLQKGRFPGYASLELLAQTSGLFLGLKFTANTAPGAIIALRNMEIYVPFIPCGETLIIESTFLGGSQHAAMFEGTVLIGKRVVMKASITLSLFPEEEKT